MQLLTEADLRAMCIPAGMVLPLPAGAALTPLAREYCAERGIVIEIAQPRQQDSPHGMMTMSGGSMPSTPTNLRFAGNPGYVDAQTGRHYSEKPEHMTHLRENLLVPKTHPRIRFRGKLDSLEALLLQDIAQARALDRPHCAEGLEECLAFTKAILAAEVKEEPLPRGALLGMDSAGLRHASHHPENFAGLPHPEPHAGMGALCLALNYLRTQVREAELSAAEAFCGDRAGCSRPDMIEALNRLSSAVYLLFLKELTV